MKEQFFVDIVGKQQPQRNADHRSYEIEKKRIRPRPREFGRVKDVEEYPPKIFKSRKGVSLVNVIGFKRQKDRIGVDRDIEDDELQNRKREHSDIEREISLLFRAECAAPGHFTLPVSVKILGIGVVPNRF